MTPLALQVQRIISDQNWSAFLNWSREMFVADFNDIHCFEVTAIRPMWKQIAPIWNVRRDDMSHLAFTPAEKTWVEHSYPGAGRSAWFVVRADSGVRVYLVESPIRSSVVAINAVFHLEDLRSTSVAIETPPWIDPRSATDCMLGEEYLGAQIGWLQMTLGCINSPKIVGRVEHRLHKRLQRAPNTSPVVFHDWAEIKLLVGPPREIAGGESVRLTGKRALHFCRQHLRLRLGRLEMVSEHWRGDPELGLRRRRYRVEPQSGLVSPETTPCIQGRPELTSFPKLE